MMIKDPVTNFVYPDEWVDRCKSAEAIKEVTTGLAVLTSSGNVLRRGFTTGTTAAAACKAAVLSLAGDISRVNVRLPCGLNVDIPVKANKGTASCSKYSGDYRDDVTAELEFIAIAEINDNGIKLNPGEGIGIFVRDTPRYPQGSPAITHSANNEIISSIREAVKTIGVKGVTVRLSVPEGRKVAQRTLNPRIGIENGISIAGTTGLVEPWDDHLEESVHERIRRADKIVLTTGRIGLRYSRMLFPGHEAILVGSGISRALKHARGDVIICGLPGLILKFIDADVLKGTHYNTVEEMSASQDFKARLEKIIKSYRSSNPGIRIVIIDRSGNIIGDNG
jgi:cobalt-precorrin-5B (C1)-methyltransferase